MRVCWVGWAKRSIVLICAVAFAGCASVGGTNPRDPLERYNRAVFAFNDTLDTYVTKPVAEGYRAVLPGFVRTGVRNFFGNLEDVWIGANNLLQGKFEAGLSDIMRVGINTIIGMGGLLDVASEGGIEKHNEDFGQTLGRWGVGSGPYFVLPFFGPSTIRDSAALPVDISASLVGPAANAISPSNSTALSYSLWGVNFIRRRADLLDATALVDQAALDKYSFIRDAYLQRRRNLVYDGKPPPEKDDDLDEPVKPETKPQAPPGGTSGPECCLPEAQSPEPVGKTLIDPVADAGRIQPDAEAQE